MENTKKQGHTAQNNQPTTTPAIKDLEIELGKQKYEIADWRYDVKQLIEIADDCLLEKFTALLQDNPFNVELRQSIHKYLDELTGKINDDEMPF